MALAAYLAKTNGPDMKTPTEMTGTDWEVIEVAYVIYVYVLHRTTSPENRDSGSDRGRIAKMAAIVVQVGSNPACNRMRAANAAE